MIIAIIDPLQPTSNQIQTQIHLNNQTAKYEREREREREGGTATSCNWRHDHSCKVMHDALLP